jgi:hypothetical protein
MLDRRTNVAVAHANPRLQGNPIPVKTKLPQGTVN